MSDGRIHIATLTLVLVSAAMAALHFISLGGTPAFRLDDAWIVLNNADALRTTDTAFPEVPPLTGSTSLIHTLLVAFISIFMPPELGLLTLGWTGLVLFSLGASCFARLQGAKPWEQILFGVMAFVSGDLYRVHLNGLETSLVLAAIIWSACLAAGRAGPVRIGLLLGSLPFLRAELGLLSLFAAVVWALDNRRANQIAAGASIAIATGLAFASIRFWLSGNILPHTGSAKMAFFGINMHWTELAGFGFAKIALFVIETALPVAILLVMPRATSLVSIAFTAFGFFLLALLAVHYTVVLEQNYYRYVYFVFPIALLNGACWLSAGSAPRAVVLSIMSAAILISALEMRSSWSDRSREVLNKRLILAEAADWISTRLVPTKVVLIDDIGYISYATEQRLFDIVGLRSPDSISVNKAFANQPDPERRGAALARLANETGACYLMVSTGWNSFFRFVDAMRAQGWTLIPHKDGHPPGHEVYLLDRRGCSFHLG